MLSGVTRETRVLCSKLCSTGSIMLKLCRTKMTLPPHRPIGLYPLINIPSLSFLKELLDNSYSIKHLMSKRKVGNCEALKGLLYVFGLYQNTLGTSLRYQVPKIFPLLSTLYILERVAGKICIHLSQFSETEALYSKNISILPALCLMLQM